MVYLYLCTACQDHKHGECELAHPAPPGVYGGSLCSCPCRGNPRWNTPEYLEEELHKLSQSIADHQKASEEIMKKSNLEISQPPKKIELKKIDKEVPMI